MIGGGAAGAGAGGCCWMFVAMAGSIVCFWRSLKLIDLVLAEVQLLLLRCLLLKTIVLYMYMTTYSPTFNRQTTQTETCILCRYCGILQTGAGSCFLHPNPRRLFAYE